MFIPAATEATVCPHTPRQPSTPTNAAPPPAQNPRRVIPIHSAPLCLNRGIAPHANRVELA